VADSVLLAALARGLVDVAVRQWHRRVRPLDLSQQTLRAAAWRASRHGITEDLYDPLADGLAPAWRVVERLREHAGPALEANGDATLVERALGRLRARGTGAEQQRAWATTGGPDAALIKLAAPRTASPHSERGARRVCPSLSS